MFICAFASGFSALVYEVAWVRILSIDFGTTVYAISTVLTIFMGGLAVGSYLFGRWVDRAGTPLRMYAAVQFGVAAYAVLFLFAAPHLHQISAWALAGRTVSHIQSSLVKFVIATVVLLPPAALMGGTWPVMAKCVTGTGESIGMRLGLVYGLNTLGAVLGCLAEAYILILRIGVSGSILFAAGVNLLVGLSCCVVALSTREGRPAGVEALVDDRSAAETGVPDRSRALGRPLLYGVAFASGFVTLASEVLWTRLFTNFLTGNVLIFASILAAFLNGIALGSLLVARWVDRLARLDRTLTILMVVSALALLGSVAGQGALAALFRTVRGLDSVFSETSSVYLCLGTLFLVVSVPAVVLGAVFPLLFRWTARNPGRLGRDMGRLYAVNTAGSIGGSFVSGFILIALIGVNASLLLLALCYATLAFCVSRERRLRLISGGSLAVCLGLILMPSIRRPTYWQNDAFNTVRRIPEEATMYLQEGPEATVGVRRERDALILTVNGVTVAENTSWDLWDLLLKAHLPMLLHRNPRNVALVGLGAGISLGAVQAYDIERVDCIEIAPGIVPAHRFFGAFNAECWKDPRLRLWINDGRHFLQTTDRRYDVISVDPTDPPVCPLYTQDFFQLCHDRLSPEGLMVQWVPLFHLSPKHVRVILGAFVNVFRESTLWYDGTSVLVLGKKAARLSVDFEAFFERLSEERVQENLSLISQPDGHLLLATYVCGPKALRRLVGRDIPRNTDDFPYLEYSVLLSGRPDNQTIACNLAMLLPFYEMSDVSSYPGDRVSVAAERLRFFRGLMRDLLRLRIYVLQGQSAAAHRQITYVAKKYSVDPDEWRALSPFTAPAVIEPLRRQQREERAAPWLPGGGGSSGQRSLQPCR